jgi:polysaccharide biosynthesis protein PelF
MARFSVLMCSEGTYPYYSGGVSVWCDQLIRGLPDIDFRLFAISHAPNRTPAFSIPPNVIGINSVSLWGTEEPGWQDASFAETYQRKARTTPDVIRTEFMDVFEVAVNCLLRGGGDPERLANALTSLHVYFKYFDFSKTMTSPEAWELFLHACQGSFPEGESLTIHEVTACMRWMQRFLGILAAPFPVTDITHSSMSGLAAVPGVINKLTKGIPLLLTEHGIYIRELYLSLMRSGYSNACRRFLLAFNQAIVEMNYHHADQITALGTFNKSWQIQFGAPAEKICITPNGADPDRFYPGRIKSDDRPVVLTLARIYHLKGIQYLLRAAGIVRSRIPAVLFRILGEVADPEYFRECQAIVSSLGLENSVEFATTSDASRAFPTADVFCLPSISEGMPYSIIEAMFSGCPIVATDVGNVSEVLSGTGIVVCPADPDALAHALLSLLSDGDASRAYRDGLANAALARAQSLYTIEQAVGRFRTLYESLTYDGIPSKMCTASV